MKYIVTQKYSMTADAMHHALRTQSPNMPILIDMLSMYNRKCYKIVIKVNEIIETDDVTNNNVVDSTGFRLYGTCHSYVDGYAIGDTSDSLCAEITGTTITVFGKKIPKGMTLSLYQVYPNSAVPGV